MPIGVAQQSLDLGDSPLAPLGGDRLAHWPPDLSALDAGWGPLVQGFLGSESGRALSSRLLQALSAGQTIYPAEPFKALSLTPLDQVRVVILGQDPYHGPGQAHGLAFSVAPGVRIPPSLRNIFKELQQSLGVPPSADGSLVRWAQQGVLLLNTCLTVEAGQAGSHAGWGWEVLTDALITAVAQSPRPVVFMLWGAHAQAKKKILDAVPGSSKHLILQANHPSPLSAMRQPLPFIGCGHFASAQLFAAQIGRNAIAW
jgi:uracil-DNA glycosylase